LIPDSRHIIVELSFLGKTAPAYTRLPRVQASQHQVGMPNLPLLEYAIVERKREAKTTRPHTQDPKTVREEKKKIPSQITIEMQQRVLLPLGRRKVFSTEYFTYLLRRWSFSSCMNNILG